MASYFSGKGATKQNMIFQNIKRFIFVLLFLAVMPSSSYAAPAACNALHGLAFCNCAMFPNAPAAGAPLGTLGTPLGSPGIGVFAPLYECFTDTTMVNDTSTAPPRVRPRGIIPHAAYKIFTDSNVFTIFRTIIISMYSLAVLFLGFKIYMGEMRDMKKEIFLVIFKLCAVIYFLNKAPTLYIDLLNFMTGLSDIVTDAGSGLRGAIHLVPAYTNTSTSTLGGLNFWGRCVAPSAGIPVSPTTTLHLWQMWDCTFNYLIGLSDVSNTLSGVPNPGLAFSGILTFALLLSLTIAPGMIILLLVLYFVSTIIGLLMRFLQTFIMSVMAVSFLFLIGYLFIPLILFRKTYHYFETWLKHVIGALLTPVIMMGFMIMALVALDVVLFTGKNSLFAKIVYDSQNRDYNSTQTNSAFREASGKRQDQFFALARVSYDNHSSAGCTGNAVDGGVLGTVRKSTTSGTSTYANIFPTDANIGNEFKGLHLVSCSANPPAATDPPGCTPPGATGITPGSGLWEGYPGATPPTLYKYVSGIMYAVAVACLLVYILHAVMGYLPNLVNGIVSQGSGIGQAIAGAALPGQETMGKAFNSMSSSMLSNSGKLNAAIKNTFVRPKMK